MDIQKIISDYVKLSLIYAKTCHLLEDYEELHGVCRSKHDFDLFKDRLEREDGLYNHHYELRRLFEGVEEISGALNELLWKYKTDE